MTAATDRRSWMAEARERSGRSQESLAHHLGVSTKTISSWERGLATPRVEIRAELADALGFTMAELGRRLGLDSAPSQASLNGDGPGAFGAITSWLSMIIRAEQSAHAIWALAMASLPALCQTADYARAVELGGHRQFTPDEIDDLVAARLARAAVLERAEFTALIAAPLLDAGPGGPEVMAAQLAHLLGLADRPNVALLVIDAGHLFAAPGPFTLLATAGPDPDTAIEAGLKGTSPHEGPVAAADHAALFDHLVPLALGREASRAAIARATARFAAMAATKQRGNP